MSAPGPLTLGELFATAFAYLGIGDVPEQRAPLTLRLYEGLPPMYRRADVDGTLFTYLSAIGDLAGALELLGDAVAYVPPDTPGAPAVDTSLLVDPAETGWTTWLAWMVGVDLAEAGIPAGQELTAEARALIAGGVNGYKAGSNEAIATAARQALTGTRTVMVRPGVDADPHVITVSTVAAETPDTDALTAAIVPVLPAGHGLALDNNVGNWQGVEAENPWDDLETAAPTWDDIEALFA